MSLLPLLLYDAEIQPRRITDQLFGTHLSPNDFISDIFDRPLVRNYSRAWRNLSSIAKDVGSTIKSDKDKFQINLDVQHFSPEEISVKVADNCVIVEGQHEEKKDEHGYISRQFKRRYILPKDCNGDSVESKLSSDGVLSIIAPKKAIENERVVTISQTGPVRRKIQDSDEQQNQPNCESEIKSPQKKKRR